MDAVHFDQELSSGRGCVGPRAVNVPDSGEVREPDHAVLDVMLDVPAVFRGEISQGEGGGEKECESQEHAGHGNHNAREMEAFRWDALQTFREALKLKRTLEKERKTLIG